MTSTARFGLLPIVCLAVSIQATQGEEKTLTVCAVPASMPRMGKAADGTPQGLDVAVARSVGRRLGRPIEFHWCAGAECAWHCLPEGRCDLVIGQPIDSGPPREVAWSVPYASAQFGLVVPRDRPDVRSLDELRGKRIGIVAGTVVLGEKDHAVARFGSREELLDRFRTAPLDAAFLDSDFASWYLHDHPQLDLRLVAGFVPRERWSMAIAVRAKDGPLLVEINRALAQLADSGELRRIYTEQGVSYHPPFTEDARHQQAPSTWRRVRDRGEVVVCFDPANLPYSSAREDRPGFDVELARALAERLHVKLRIEWLDIQRETAVGKLLQHACDLVFGEAVDVNAVEDDEELAGKVVYSRPYYGSGYVLVRREEGPRVRSLAELKGERSHRLGTEAGSVADYRLRRRGYFRRLYRNQLATLKALADGDIDFAYLWANAGWTMHVSPEFPVELVPTDVPEDRWKIAIAMNRGEDELKQHVDEALDTLIKDGTVSRALARYHLPDLAPVQDADAEETIRHKASDRGREPVMQKIQGSKHGYRALVRIHSAGELVVGLDQENLPFSTAHPIPAGLDYEIADLLAEQLGVSLRVYWAYSTHDSYPSKLAAKKLCDVILGVMADDRFAQRVLYSRPYYVASYQWVVRTGEGPPSSHETVAVEEGVAVRGLNGRAVQFFPSTEAILEAVATGRVRAGYVISTRGPWLAHRRWPGKLAFLAVPGSVDRHPICAAVRKADGDLKDEIDRAWEELDRTGRLAQLFERWHISYPSVHPEEIRQAP
jgi:polar amino acid transport system substrate-binding protein